METFNKTRTSIIGMAATMVIALCSASSATPRHHHEARKPAQVVLDLTPVVVQPFIFPQGIV
jgi:hypothetical protein